jgi:group I intron endonuclease
MEDKDLVDDRIEEDSIKEDKRWCVYCHRNVHNDKRYIGITSQDVNKRWGVNGSNYLEKRNGHYAHPVFAHALLKYSSWNEDWEHIILYDNMSEAQAKDVEKLLIANYKTNVYRYHNPTYGYNCTDGGDGTCGTHLSEDTRMRISEHTKGENNPMYGVCGSDHPMFGRQHSEESKQKMSKNRSGKLVGKDNPMYGVKRYGEDNPMYNVKRYGVDNPNYGNIGIKNKASVIRYCLELNEFFCGAKEVERCLGIPMSSVAKACRKVYQTAGRHPETGDGLHWFYVEEAIANGYITKQDLDNYLNNLKNKGDIEHEN